ncbi:MAG: DUF4430 domain-containing protein [Lachnospiraceae bacterium]|nr:DUF4430 domain-containing protein [Lachnospiraceae bacterium]
MDKKKRNLLIGAGLFVALIALVLIIYNLNKPQAQPEVTNEGSKNIIIEVKDSEGNVTTYEVTTDAEFLRQAMDEAEGLTYDGSDSEFGMMVEVVNGEQAIYAEDNAYWAFYVNGEYGQYGIDSQPVTDGDTYSIVYEAAN